MSYLRLTPYVSRWIDLLWSSRTPLDLKPLPHTGQPHWSSEKWLCKCCLYAAFVCNNKPLHKIILSFLSRIAWMIGPAKLILPFLNYLFVSNEPSCNTILDGWLHSMSSWVMRELDPTSNAQVLSSMPFKSSDMSNTP